MLGPLNGPRVDPKSPLIRPLAQTPDMIKSLSVATSFQEESMRNYICAAAIMLAFCDTSLAEPEQQPSKPAVQVKKGRSWEECNKLAQERGVVRPSNTPKPHRYEMRQGFGEPTNKPQGLIARCMAGEPI
jgi:hypothetical protein